MTPGTEFLAAYPAKLMEYGLGVAYLVLFVPFWRYVQGTAAPVRHTVFELKEGVMLEALAAAALAVVVFLAGVAARLGIVLAAMAALAVPAVLVLGAWRGARWLLRRLHGLQLAGGLPFRPGLLYAPGHTWARRERGGARVGVDGLAQRILPYAVSVHLPKAGVHLRAGEAAAVISAGGHEATVRAPFDGTVEAVNAAVALSPGLVKSDGYGRGWLFRLRPDADGALDGLRSGAAARGWLADEGRRLQGFLETRLGMAAADGGEIVEPLCAHLSEEDWKALTAAFLR